MDPVKVRHRWWKKMWVTPIERWLFGTADRVVATCEDEVEWIKEFEPRVKSVEMLSLSGGVDFSRVERVDRVGDADGSLRLLFIGRLHPLKGVEFLLGAMNDLLSQKGGGAEKQSLELRIIGKDEGEGDKLRQMAKDYGLDVEFCGVVSEEEKEQAWEWCDVLVLPTLSENFGLVVAEALERGKRVITTDGAPVWGEGLSRVERVDRVEGELGIGFDGRLIYLKCYRDGSDEERVELLKAAIEVVGDGNLGRVERVEGGEILNRVERVESCREGSRTR
jgi:glycosyltransferase involved in cell wall biosynthesis